MAASLFVTKPIGPEPHVDAGEPVEGSLQGEVQFKRALTARHLILTSLVDDHDTRTTHTPIR